LVFLNNEVDFDIIHINHKPIGEMILQMYPNTPAVMHVRSEVIPVYEEPIIHPVIKKYISIRDSITEYIKGFGISEDLITHIDNPFDTTRFNTNYEPIKNDREVVLFVGTHDYLRKAMLFDLVDKTREKNQDLWLVGEHNSYVDELVDNKHVHYFGVVSDVENYMKKCDYTAGIFNGRTTIEGFLCGKPAIIYYVDKEGNILNSEIVEVPDDIEKYSATFSAKKVFILYKETLSI
ncbi:MAG: hypothetical protein ACOCVF_03550, partial [bacterium]